MAGEEVMLRRVDNKPCGNSKFGRKKKRVSEPLRLKGCLMFHASLFLHNMRLQNFPLQQQKYLHNLLLRGLYFNTAIGQ
jgi:hypothetical protein